jgi:hypothetical protein
LQDFPTDEQCRRPGSVGPPDVRRDRRTARVEASLSRASPTGGATLQVADSVTHSVVSAAGSNR